MLKGFFLKKWVVAIILNYGTVHSTWQHCKCNSNWKPHKLKNWARCSLKMSARYQHHHETHTHTYTFISYNHIHITINEWAGERWQEIHIISNNNSSPNKHMLCNSMHTQTLTILHYLWYVVVLCVTVLCVFCMNCTMSTVLVHYRFISICRDQM